MMTLIRTAVAGTLAAAVAMSAAPASAAPGPQTVAVTANLDRLVAPAMALRPGATTFTVRTPDPNSRYVGVIGLRAGVSLSDYLDDMATVLFSADGPAREQAGARVSQNLVLGGGVAVSGRAAQSITLLLRPGSYYLVDYTSLGRPDPTGHWHPITVSGSWSTALPTPDHVVVQHERVAGQPRFLAPPRIGPRGSLLTVNSTAVLHEAVFIPVRPETTDADLDRYLAGQGPAPFTGGPQGMLPIAGGQAAVLHLDLAPGRYALMSWVGRDAFTGMHHILDVTAA